MNLSRLSRALPLLILVPLAGAQTRPHNFDLLDVRWHVDLKSYEDTGLLTGDVVSTMKVLSDPTQVRFDCARLTAKSVLVNGKPAKFKLDDKMVTVLLPSGAKIGQTFKIHVFYSGRPTAGIYLVPASRAYPAHTNVIYTQGEMEDNRYWLPTWDYPDDKATSEGFIEIGKGERVISNGKLVEVIEKPDRQIFHWKMDQAHATYLISIVAGKFDKGSTGTFGSMPVDFYTPEGLIDQGEVAFGGTEKIIEFYSRLTGFKYPYAKFCQSAVPDYMFGGMENITAVTQTINALHPRSVDEVRNSTGLVAHELAHQWFGDTVTCNGWSDAWLNEGFATFLPNFWEREKNGEEAFALGRYGDFQGGLAAHHQSPDRPVVWKGYKNALDMFNNFIYPGGASRMFMLMDQLGEAKFWKSITAYLNERKYTSLDTPMFFDSMSRASGVDLKPFMKQWFYTAAAPNLKVAMKGSKLSVTQPMPYFDLNLDVWVLDGDSWVKKNLHLTDQEATVDLGSLAGKPVLVDPRCFVMADISNGIQFTVEDRIRLFLKAPNAGEQARIVDSMMGDFQPQDWLSFAKRIKSARLLGRVLGHLGADAQTFLIDLTHNSDRELANAAVQNLGRFPSSPELADRLKEIAANDPDDVIRQNATRSMLNQSHDQTAIEKLLSTDGFDDGYRSMGLEFLAQLNPDRAREACLEALLHPTAEPTRVQAIRLLGNLKDKPNDLRVYKALVAILKETSFGARFAAISSLAQYGNSAAIPLLQPYTTHSLVFFREASEGAIAQLKGR